MATTLKLIGGSKKYKYVELLLTKEGKERWRGKRWRNGKYFDTEREAALYVDRQLIEKGMKPVNILVRRQ